MTPQVKKNIEVIPSDSQATNHLHFSYFQKVHMTSLEDGGWVTPTVATLRILVIIGTLLYTIFYQVGNSLGYVIGITPDVEAVINLTL